MIEKFPFAKLPHAYIRQGLLTKGGLAAYAVYGVHLNVAPGDWGVYNLAVATIAKFADISPSTVRRANAFLKDEKVIEAYARLSGSGQKSNCWQLLPPSQWCVGGAVIGDWGGQSPEIGGPSHGREGLNNNKNPLTRTKTTTIIEELPLYDLDDAVVVILKNLGVDKSFWPQLNGMATNRIQALATMATKKGTKNPGGYFRKSIENGWNIPGYDKHAFEIQCDLIRRTAKILKSKATGREYEILKYKTGSKLVIATDARGEVTIGSEKELMEWTWAA